MKGSMAIDDQAIVITGLSETVQRYTSDDIVIYDLYHHVWKYRYVLSIQAKTAKGEQLVRQWIPMIEQDEAFMEINEEPYFISELNDRIYCLQQTSLSLELPELLHKADTAYLNDQDEKALKLVIEIESECHKRGIEIFTPDKIAG